jgi:glyoxalase family protein
VEVSAMPHRGVHHVTAIASFAHRNLDFYVGVLGLRLVKKTVNFDDPGTYHLYYGDEIGRPGTILTFFPWEGVPPGRLGVGETHETSFRIPEGSVGYWTHRLLEKGVAHDALTRRFDEPILSFKDPDGTRLALVGSRGIESEPGWSGGDVPAEHVLRGFHGVTLLLADAAPTGAILTDVLGFAAGEQEGSTRRYRADAVAGTVVDLRAVGGFPRGQQGAGSVHHIAFRAADDADQAEMVRKLRENHGVSTTEQKDRNYFRSVYFREPGHILFEIATEPPGFAVDEPVETLGRALKLPAFLEGRRARIEAALPKLEAAPASEPVASLSFIHKFEPGAAPPLLLLHGTGGDETDLLPLGRMIAPGAALLSPRGKVLENGMPRFFRRIREGVFDEDDVRRRAEELADFVGEARKAYAIGAPVAVGFSNGANIAAAVLLLRPEALAGAVLIRAMSPFHDPPQAALTGKPVLILSGDADPVVPLGNVARLAATLTGAGAAVQHETILAVHTMIEQDVILARAFLAGLRTD